jgi:hypothetical protein
MTLNINQLARFSYVLIVLFVIVFPKGGVKVSDIPLTWGYLICFLIPLLWVYPYVRFCSYRQHEAQRFIVFGFCFFLSSALLLLLLLGNGFLSLGFALALFISFVYMPFFFVFMFPFISSHVCSDYKLAIVRKAVTFVAIYGIALFFYKIIVGDFFVVPYLTINASDVGELTEKHINRGGLFKLISTYNNGNIYGVSILMLLPLYCEIQTKAVLRWVVKLSLILTLSRTVWIGLILYELANSLFGKKISAHKFFGIVISCAILIMTISLVMDFLGWDNSSLFDKDLGGRADNLSALANVQIVSFAPFDVISEMTGLSFLGQFGMLPTFFVYLMLFSPLILSITSKPDLIQKKISLGLILYLVVSQSDGAALFIPVMAIYWFCCSFLFFSGSRSSRIGGEHGAY